MSETLAAIPFVSPFIEFGFMRRALAQETMDLI